MTYTARKSIREALDILDANDAARDRAIRDALEEMRRAKYRAERAKAWARK